MPRWTHEARIRQSELIKTWEPWKHSTGPVSEGGKQNSSMNAWKHGFRSELMRQSYQRFRVAMEISRSQSNDY